MTSFGKVVLLQDPTNLLQLWLEYCGSRGLTPEVLDPVGGELLTLDAASKLVGTTIFGLKQHGAIGAYVFPLAPGEYQARIIADPGHVSTPKPGEQVKPKVAKYFRQKNAANILYIPPHVTDWYNPDIRYNLLIVEGALNAVRLASSGFHATGITGVFNYHTGGKYTPIIPELVRLVQGPQVERITIMFDSDTGDPDSKRELWNGIHSFAQDLMKLRPDRRNTIYICRPPSKANGDKNGPDDYLNATSIDEFNRLLREESQCYDDSPYLRLERQCLDRFIFDETSGNLWDCNIRALIKPEHANRNMMTLGVVDDILANKPTKVVYTTDRLLKTADVRKAHGVRFQPSIDEPFYLDEQSEPPAYRINKFSPLDVPKAMKGDVSIAYEMLRSLTRDSPAALDKILTICARHAQSPAETPKFGILLTGEQRAGKSNFARLIGSSLSKRYHDARVNLKVDFNSDWRGYACKEWPEFDKNMDEEWLKDLITGDTYMVSVKYGVNYAEKNHTLNVFTCNGLQSKIQEGDSRFVIGGYAKQDNKALGLEFEKWVRSTGPNYFRYHLLNEIDASGYDALDVHTEMRKSVIDASQSYRDTVKDYILEELEQLPDLECVPNGLLESLLRPYDVKVISFNKVYGQYFIRPALEVVKIEGATVRFRAFKNLDRWKGEVNPMAYRLQYELANEFVKKFGTDKF